MKDIYIIRHAESTSNAGQRTDSHDNIPLSEKGRKQAQELAETFNVTPDLIVVSSFSRTRETAEPYLKKFPGIPVEVWDVHEFTYLSPKHYVGTRPIDRFGKAMRYWKNAHVQEKEDDETESFAELTKRMELFLERLRERPEHTIVIFSHGRFILGLKLYMEKIKKLGRKDLTDEELHELKRDHGKIILQTIAGGKFPIDNVSMHKLELD